MEELLEKALEVIIPVLELMGIFIVAAAAVENFVRYLYYRVTHRRPHVKGALARELMLGLEFMMVAEILKTIVVRDVKELLILGGVVIIRAILAFELSHEEKEEKEEDKEEREGQA